MKNGKKKKKIATSGYDSCRNIYTKFLKDHTNPTEKGGNRLELNLAS